MKNLVFNLRTAKAQAEGCAKVSRMAKILTTLTLLLTLGVGQMWAGKGFWGSGQWNVKYYDGSGSDKWIGEGDDGATKDLGIKTTLYLKGSWVKTWSDGGWTQSSVVWNYGLSSSYGNTKTASKSSVQGNQTWDFSVDYNVIANAPNNPGQNTIYMYWRLDDYVSSTASYINFTIPGFKKTSVSQDFGNVTVSSTKDLTISFTQHYGTALTTSNCALSGTNSSEFEVRSISETGVTVRFKPSSNGSKSATLTITDAHSKTCTITLSGKTRRAVTYKHGDYTTGSDITDYKVYGTNLTLRSSGFTRTGYNLTAWNTGSNGTSGTNYDLGATYSTNSTLTLYPTWTAITVSATVSPSSGTVGANNLTFSISSNVPTNSGYYVAVYNFGESDYSGGYLDGDKLFDANPKSYACTTPSLSTGTVYTRAVVIKDGAVVATSDIIAFTVASDSDPSWSMYNDATKLGDFTNNGDGSHSLVVTIPAGGYSLLHYNNDQGFVGVTGAESLTTERTLVNNNGRIAWQDGAGTFRITIRKDGSDWKISAVRVYSVTYNGNGKTGGSVPTDDTYYTSGSTVTVKSNSGSLVRTNYSFGGWNTNASGTGTNYTAGSGTFSITADTELFAKWNETMHTVTVSRNSTTLGTVSTSSVSAGVSTASTTITATPVSGATFTGWTIPSGVTLASGTTSSASITINATADSKTITANFSETTYTVNVALSDASQSNGTTNPNGDTQVGAITPVQITAPTPKTGFSSTGRWTTTGGVTVANETANPTTITATSAGTVRWTFDEDLSSPWIVAGGNKIVTTGTTWRTTADANNTMLKKTGHSTESVVYFTVPVTTVCSGDNNENFQFKIYNTSTSTWYGLFASGSYYLLKAEDGTEKSLVKDNQNIELRAYVTGNYEFKLDYSTSTPKLTVNWPEINQVRISSASPADATNVGDFDLSAPVSNVRSKTLSLNANTTYTFKIVYDSEWYGYNSGTFTRSTSTSSNSRTLSTSGGDMTLTTDYAGDYTFKFNESTKVLSIDFPEAYKITWGVGTVPGNKYTITCKKYGTEEAVTSNSTWILSGNKVTFYAGNNDPTKVVKDGYTWRGYYSEAAGTTQLSNQTGYSPIINAANMSFYACFYENNYTVTVNAGTGGKVNSLSSTTITGHVATLANLPTATADPGYYFVNWTTTAGTLTNSTSATNGKINDLTSTATVTANFAPLWSLAGGLDGGSNWPLDAAHKFTSYSTNASSHQEGHLSFDLAANSSYWIKLYNNQSSAYYGLASGSSTRDVYYSSPSTGWDITGATGNISLYVHTAAAGTYDFYWDIEANKLYVHYPTSLFITSGQKTEGQDDNAGGSFTALDNGSRDVTGGKFVANGASVIFEATPNTGYNFDGWYTDETCTGDKNTSNPMTVSSITVDKTVYAKFVPKTYPITLTRTGTGYGSGGDASVTATYNQTMPVATMPTAAQGYAFMGFYTATGGGGSKMINADGTWANVSGYISGGKWIRDGGATLFAYYKKAEITAITLNSSILDLVAAGGTGFVIANPTIAPTPVLPVKICWELLYDNGNSVPAGHEAIDDHDGSHPNRVKFSIAGLAAGGYKIKATLRTGDDCSGGTLLSEREVSFTIASGYTVTIQYKDTEGNTIAPSTTSPGKATDWTSISAPTIVGYKFSTWVPGDGITLESSATTNSNRFKATFNGTLTARYTKKRVIYFNNTLGWSNVYVYFYSSNKYWADNYGTGAYAGKYFDGYKPYSDQRHGHMTQIEGTNIWYFDYTAAGYDTYENIAFANMDKSNSGTDNTPNNDLGFFSNTPSDPIQVVRRGDHNASLPMFVPLAGQPKTKLNNNKAEYSNQGYWMNYPENTGYALRLFNSSGVEIDSIPFEFTPDKTMPMSVTYILDGSKTYQFKLYRTDGKWFGNNGTMKAGASGDIGETSWEFKEKDGETTRNNCQIKTNAAGTYTFTLDFGNKDGYNYLIGVHYPAAANDFQILYNDNAEWSLGSAHDANWVHPSRIIRARENGVDTISFFVAKDNAPILKARKVSSIHPSTGAITWGSLNISGAAKQDLTVDSSAVYNFKVTQGAAGVINSIQYIGAYTGNYYIRSSALSNKWGNYVDNLDHRMTYSSFSESNANSFGEKYSHYKAKWCPRNTNIAFCIANDYSPCITDTLKQDVGNPYNNTESDGTLKYEKSGSSMKYNDNNAYLDRYSANVRFMWDRKTNKISRAYISAATSGLAQFLVLRAGQELHNENNVAISSSPANSVLLSDNENWIYEARLMIKPGTRFKLYACYAKSPVDPASAQYFRGAYDSDNFTSDDNSVILIGGESVDYQLARIVYDFKTNRLIAAWMPSGEVSGTNEINADIMVIRDHQESARCITFADASANLSKVKTVYGVMRFNRWILNNRQHPEDQTKEHARPDHIVEDLAEHHPPLSVGQQKSTYERRLYFISFPFDVLVGDIFGFGTYGQYWVIQYYDGLNRAKKGYWMDSKPNWKYVSPTQVAQGYKLEKNQGYILELNLSAMAADNTTFWSNGISTIELYFPSTVNQDILKQTDITIPALSDEYKCTINRGTAEGDRRVKDSYWRCIGVPSYNLYNSALKDGSGNEISWKTNYTWKEDESEFPFIYMWNKTDNTLTPQSTSAFLFQPMHAYLTQIKSAIVWTAVSAKPSSIVARRAGKEATKEYNWRIELKQDTTFLDQTYVRMTDLEQVTDNFDFGQDLIKELNSRSNIYTFIGYEKVAANSMTLHTDQTTVIPVGANITTEGDYTFALPDGADGIGVTLIDEETGTRTNLSAGMDYTVYLEKGTHDNRFWLEISPVQQTPTDIELINGENGDASLNGVRKVLIDGLLYIVKDGKLFDARGARVE